MTDTAKPTNEPLHLGRNWPRRAPESQRTEDNELRCDMDRELYCKAQDDLAAEGWRDMSYYLRRSPADKPESLRPLIYTLTDGLTYFGHYNADSRLWFQHGAGKVMTCGSSIAWWAYPWTPEEAKE